MGKKESMMRFLLGFKKSVSEIMPVTKMILFGSMARGDFKKDSDVDLIVVSSEFNGMRFSKRNSKLYDFWNIDCPVDFLCLTPEEFNKMKKQVSIVSMALKEGAVIA